MWQSGAAPNPSREMSHHTTDSPAETPHEWWPARRQAAAEPDPAAASLRTASNPSWRCRPHADKLASPGFLQLTAAEPLTQQSPLVLGDGALDLQQKLITRTVADGVVEELNRTASAADLFEQQRLIDVFTRQPIQADDSN